MRWRDAPKQHFPRKALYKCWLERGVCALTMDGLATEAAFPQGGTQLMARGTAYGRKVGSRDYRFLLIGSTNGGMNIELYVMTDAQGRPIRFFMNSRNFTDR